MPINLKPKTLDFIEMTIYMVATIIGGILAYKYESFLKLLFSALIGSMFGIFVFLIVVEIASLE